VNDLRILRDRQTVAANGRERAARNGLHFGSAALCVVSTRVTTYPTTAATYYACNPELLGGSEAEGAAPTFARDGATVIYALNVGTAIPPEGTKLVIHATGGRWCFRYDG
jgi:hypothetical protein